MIINRPLTNETERTSAISAIAYDGGISLNSFYAKAVSAQIHIIKASYKKIKNKSLDFFVESNEYNVYTLLHISKNKLDAFLTKKAF